ncbi:hypothetical protein J433_12722 [Corynebacterium glutamicum MT]|nr:hypothetical protein J433_12722 [Corynebacterium glutamicum MT]
MAKYTPGLYLTIQLHSALDVGARVSPCFQASVVSEALHDHIGWVMLLFSKGTKNVMGQTKDFPRRKFCPNFPSLYCPLEPFE